MTDKPYPYQTEDITKLLEMPKGLLAHEPGLGKTRIALEAAHLTGAYPMLVICPKSVRSHWVSEADRWIGREAAIVGEKQAPIMIAHYDALPKVWPLVDQAWALLVVDESTYCKNRLAQRTRRVWHLAGRSGRVWLLSGSPIWNRPIDLWAQLKMISTNVGSYWAFARQFANAHRTRFGWDVSGASHLDLLAARLRRLLIRRRKADVLTQLPPKRWEVVELGPADAEESETMNPEVRRRAGERKVGAAIEYLSELQEPVVVFGWHHSVLKAVHKAFPHGRLVTGETSGPARDQAIDDFQTGKTDLLIGQMQAMGVGVNLSRASRVVMIELDYSPSTVIQASDRPHRPGIRNPLIVSLMVTRGGVDDAMLELLRKKIVIHRRVIDPTGVDGRKRIG